MPRTTTCRLCAGFGRMTTRTRPPKLSETMRGCVSVLDPHARKVLTMRFVHDMDVDDIAATLGRTGTEVTTILIDAHRAIRESGHLERMSTAM